MVGWRAASFQHQFYLSWKCASTSCSNPFAGILKFHAKKSKRTRSKLAPKSLCATFLSRPPSGSSGNSSGSRRTCLETGHTFAASWDHEVQSFLNTGLFPLSFQKKKLVRLESWRQFVCQKKPQVRGVTEVSASSTSSPNRTQRFVRSPSSLMFMKSVFSLLSQELLTRHILFWRLRLQWM